MPQLARLDGLNELPEKQLSVVSRGQLLAVGMTDKAMQYRVRVGGPCRCRCRASTWAQAEHPVYGKRASR